MFGYSFKYITPPQKKLFLVTKVTIESCPNMNMRLGFYSDLPNNGPEFSDYKIVKKNSIVRSLQVCPRTECSLLDHQVISRRKRISHEGTIFPSKRGWESERGKASHKCQV